MELGNIDNYECVQKSDVLKGYLEHFREKSIDNEVPGLLSFFFIQGQCALPYVRIPIGARCEDPRVNVFWVQSTRTGKSVAYQTIQEVMAGAGLECVDYSTGRVIYYRRSKRASCTKVWSIIR